MIKGFDEEDLDFYMEVKLLANIQFLYNKPSVGPKKQDLWSKLNQHIQLQNSKILYIKVGIIWLHIWQGK